MVEYLVERLSGVGALIVESGNQIRSFLVIQELRSNQRTNKLAGMLSLPMETMEEGENYVQSLRRLFKEEVVIGSCNEEEGRELCICELLPGVVLHAFLFESTKEDLIQPGSFIDEVSNVDWIRLEEVMNTSENSLRFRPGVYEVVKSYFDLQNDPAKFKPPVFRAHELKHHIPSELFEA